MLIFSWGFPATQRVSFLLLAAAMVSTGCGLRPTDSAAVDVNIPDHGMLYVSTFGAQGTNAQNPNSHAGKVLRLRDDGTTPEDNPFFGKPGYKPEIYTLGHRSPQGLAVHPGTGQVWEVEMGPNGGDELNVLRPGANCGIDLFANRDRVEPAVLGHDGALTLGPSQPTLSSS